MRGTRYARLCWLLDTTGSDKQEEVEVQGADALQAKAKGARGPLSTLLLDVTDDKSVEKARQLLEEKTKEYKGLHGVVNNAGISGHLGPDDWLTIADYKQVMDVNCFGMIRIAHALKPMVKRARGRIVNMASAAGRLAAYGTGPYATSKFGLEAYNDVLRY